MKQITHTTNTKKTNHFSSALSDCRDLTDIQEARAALNHEIARYAFGGDRMIFEHALASRFQCEEVAAQLHALGDDAYEAAALVYAAIFARFDKENDDAISLLARAEPLGARLALRT